jgi:hypothetical protein
MHLCAQMHGEVLQLLQTIHILSYIQIMTLSRYNQVMYVVPTFQLSYPISGVLAVQFDHLTRLGSTHTNESPP